MAIALLVRSAANRVLTEAVEVTIEADARQLSEVLSAGGMSALQLAVGEKSRHSSGGVYLLLDVAGRRLAGNIQERPASFEGGSGAGVFRYRLAGRQGRGAQPDEERLAAGIQLDLDGGGTLVVGREIESQRQLLSSINRSLLFGLGAFAVFGIVGGFLLARHILARIDAMSRASQAIMAGDLAGRLPRNGSGDELDRLAEQLNEMLARIERLMSGLREVSDNIAHDLKTPLNRLRNSAESALLDARGAPAWREGLQRTLEEADDLIKTFNALLLIARLEAGSIAESFETVDLAEIARDVAELYEPSAEEAGLSLAIITPPSVPTRANRQLVSQALANMLDNAIKYGVRQAGSPSVAGPGILVALDAEGDTARLSVADRGPGIAEADRKRALDRFVRLQPSRTKPGSGLGLSLVAAVAQMHNGSVALEDNQPGLRIVLSLPLAAGPLSVANSDPNRSRARNASEHGHSD
ncbi:MAG: HAMP domain-containing sensor histidine kinase [Hyphomicrobiaceae bacterium]